MTKKRHSHADDHDTDEVRGDPAMHVRAQFDALDAPGIVEVPEVLAGDVLLWLACSDGQVGNNGNPSVFEAIVTTDGELKQNLSLAGHSYDAIFLRGVS